MIALRELGAIMKLARRLDHVGKDLMFYVDKSFANEGAIEDAPGEKLSPFSAEEVVPFWNRPRRMILPNGSGAFWRSCFSRACVGARHSACGGQTCPSTAA
jgi:hypothetical protein